MAPANSNIVIGSVEGVSTAPANALTSTTQRQARNMVLASRRPRAPRSNCNTGS